MKANKYLLFILLFLFACSSNADETNIYNCFKQYKKAILEQNGSIAVKLVDSRTIEYYKTMKDYALYSTKEEIYDYSLMNKIMVFSLRHRISKDKLLSMSATELFQYAVDKGWIGRNSVADLEIAKAKVVGKTANSKFIVNGKIQKYGFDFYKENDIWKINLLSIMPISELALKQNIKKENLEENDFIFNILESISGTKVNTKTILDPLIKTTPTKRST